MKYQPVYLAETKNKELLKKQPIFNTKSKAWKYIQDKYCHCEIEIHINQMDYCESCEAEWMVDKIKAKIIK